MRARLLKLLLLIAAAPALALVTSCGTLAGGGAPDASPSSGSITGDWTVESLNGHGVLEGVTLSFRFDEGGGFSANGGVNRVRSEYSIDGAAVGFSELLSTRMAGRPELMDQEQELIDAIEGARGIRIQDGRLELFDADGQRLLAARRG